MAPNRTSTTFQCMADLAQETMRQRALLPLRTTTTGQSGCGGSLAKGAASCAASGDNENAPVERSWLESIDWKDSQRVLFDGHRIECPSTTLSAASQSTDSVTSMKMLQSILSDEFSSVTLAAASLLRSRESGARSNSGLDDITVDRMESLPSLGFESLLLGDKAMSGWSMDSAGTTDIMENPMASCAERPLQCKTKNEALVYPVASNCGDINEDPINSAARDEKAMVTDATELGSHVFTSTIPATVVGDGASLPARSRLDQISRDDAEMLLQLHYHDVSRIDSSAIESLPTVQHKETVRPQYRKLLTLAKSLQDDPTPNAATAMVTPKIGNQNVGPKSKKRKKVDDTVCNFITNGVTEFDVLMGRGGLANNHIGNKRYLEHKKTLRERYSAATKYEKTIISQELVEWVHSIGGRFLERDPVTSQWYQVTALKARRKASQTLREDYTLETLAKKRAYYREKQAKLANGS
jgi:hypothetical protein